MSNEGYWSDKKVVQFAESYKNLLDVMNAFPANINSLGVVKQREAQDKLMLAILRYRENTTIELRELIGINLERLERLCY